MSCTYRYYTCMYVHKLTMSYCTHMHDIVVSKLSQEIGIICGQTSNMPFYSIISVILLVMSDYNRSTKILLSTQYCYLLFKRSGAFVTGRKKRRKMVLFNPHLTFDPEDYIGYAIRCWKEEPRNILKACPVHNVVLVVKT